MDKRPVSEPKTEPKARSAAPSAQSAAPTGRAATAASAMRTAAPAGPGARTTAPTGRTAPTGSAARAAASTRRTTGRTAAAAGKAAAGAAKTPKRRAKKPAPQYDMPQDVKTAFITVGHSMRRGGKTVVTKSKVAANKFDALTFSQNFKLPTLPRFRGIRFSYKLFLGAIALILILILVNYYSTNITVDTRTITIPGIQSDFEGYRVLLLSDLHGTRYGKDQTRLLSKISDLKYDMVLIAGDMVGSGGDPEPFYELLEGLGTSKPVYFIAGDSDPGPLLDSARVIEGTLNQMLLEDWVLGAMDRGAQYLNKPVKIEIGNSVMWLSPGVMLNVNADEALESTEYELSLQRSGVVDGISVDRNTLPFTNYRYRQYSALKEASLYMEESDLHITLSHYPPTDETLAATLVNAYETENAYLFPADLALCGHYCGGIWRIPGLGAFYVPNKLLDRHGWFPDQSYVNGLRTSSNTMVYTTSGLGVTDYGLFIDYRLLNPPQISLITLTTRLTPDLLGQ